MPLEICPWSPNAACITPLFSDEHSAFIIASNADDREPYREAIKEVIREFELEPIFALDLDRYNGKQAFCTHICGPIRKTRIIIADLSGTTKTYCEPCNIKNVEYSINVFWEYGYAAALEKDPILIIDENQDLPFDIADKIAEYYNLLTIKDILRPLIQNRLDMPIPQNRFQVLTRLIPEEYQNTIDTEMNAFKRNLEELYLKLCFNIFPSEPMENLFPLDDQMKEFLENKNPLKIKRDRQIFRDLRDFEVTQNTFFHKSSSSWMGHNIQLTVDGIINYICYINGDNDLALVYVTTSNYRRIEYKDFPKSEILNCFLGLLNYIKEIYEYANFNGFITISLEIENIQDYHLFGDYSLEPSMEPRLSEYKQNDFRKVVKVYNVNSLEDNDSKIRIAKDFFDPILRAFGRVNLPIYDEFIEYFNSID